MESLLDNPDTEYLQNELRALAELIQEQVEEPPRVGETISREGVRINFPVKPYPAQIQMMNKIIHALNNKENALLESPTGSGKSLALLCSVLAWKNCQEELTTEKHTAERLVKLEKLSQDIISESQPDQKKQLLNQYIDNVSEPSKVRDQKAPTQIPKIYVASRTHKQLKQLIKELKTKTQYRPRTAVIGSREHLCIHKKLARVKNIDDGCRDMLDDGSCTFFKKKNRLLDNSNIRNEIWDIEDIVQEGTKLGACPYFGSRKLFEDAEVIFCPYNYIIDPTIRIAMDINLKDSIIVLDEAHNMEDASRSAGSHDLTGQQLKSFSTELLNVAKYSGLPQPHETLYFMIQSFENLLLSDDNNRNKDTHYNGQRLLEKLAAVDITSDRYYNVLLPAFRAAESHAEKVRAMREKNKEQVEVHEENSQDPEGTKRWVSVRCISNGSLTHLQSIFLILGFLFDSKQKYAEAYELVLTKIVERPNYFQRKRQRREDEDQFEGAKRKLGFWCMDPSIIFRNMCDDTHSVILTSGTLSPLNTFASELDTKFEGTLEANHVITDSQVWVGAVPYGSEGVSLKGTYDNVSSFLYQDQVGQAVCDIVNTVPYGVLCFMTSYKAINTLMDRWEATGVMKQIKSRKLVLTEPQAQDKAAFEKVLKKFFSCIKEVEDDEGDSNYDGAIMFGVFRGKISEGIDFPDNNCRAVISVGIPFPNSQDLNIQLKKSYNDRKTKPQNTLSGSEWYAAQAYRAINQALGRCIRHKNDWGAIILLEQRFNWPKSKESLSKWVKKYFQIENNYDNNILQLNNFIQSQLSEEQQEYLHNRRVRVKVEPMSTSDEEEEKGNVQHSVRTSHFVPDDSQESMDTETAATTSDDTTSTDDEESSSVAMDISRESTPLTTEPSTDHQQSSYSTNIAMALSKLLNDPSGRLQENPSIPPEPTTHKLHITHPLHPINSPKDVVIHCQQCRQSLLEGYLFYTFTETSPFTCQSNEPIMRLEYVEAWSNPGQILDDILDIKNLPKRTSAIFDSEDEITYREIFCKCDEVNSIGIQVLGVMSDRHKDRIGDIYLLNSKVSRDWN